MSIGTLRGIVTALLIVAFVGICIWAYSKRRKPQFDAAARLPLEEDSVRRDPEQKR
jgi:cytochrome c oxidase cbb3-type subunit 4